MATKPTLRQELAAGLAANVEYADQNMALRTTLANNQAAFKAKTEEASNLKADIALFKQEALQAAVREAELRGYIQRILEDDAERAEPAEEQQSSVVHTTVVPRNHPVRTGPSPMTGRGFEPNIAYRSDCAATFRNDPPSRSDPLGQRHWIER